MAEIVSPVKSWIALGRHLFDLPTYFSGNTFCRLTFLVVLLVPIPHPANAWSFNTPFGVWKGDDARVPTVNEIRDFIVNPPSVLKVTGLPDPKDIALYVINHPDEGLGLIKSPGDAVYLPVANAMISGRNAVLLNGARKIPPNIRKLLLPFYDSALLDSVRWTANWSIAQNTIQAAQMSYDGNTQAITLINTIVFRDGTAVDDASIWAHEVFHVTQYKQWGVMGFAKRWVDNSSKTGPVEAPAYQRQEEFQQQISRQRVPKVQPISTEASCSSFSNSVAYCDLWVTTHTSSPVTFTVNGDAWAHGRGHRDGSMRLVMMVDTEPCNRGAEKTFGVDNDTRLQGEDFTCLIEVEPGQGKRVFLVAPNSRADAVYTRGQAQWFRRAPSCGPTRDAS